MMREGKEKDASSQEKKGGNAQGQKEALILKQKEVGTGLLAEEEERKRVRSGRFKSLFLY